MILFDITLRKKEHKVKGEREKKEPQMSQIKKNNRHKSLNN